MRSLVPIVRVSSPVLLAFALCVTALAQQPAPRYVGKGEDPNIPKYDNIQTIDPGVQFDSPTEFPIWWGFQGTGVCDQNRRPVTILFADDLTPGYYLGFNAQGSWIVRESGKVVVFNGSTHTLSPGADSPAGAPADLQLPPPCQGKDPSPWQRGMVVKDRDGNFTLSYTLAERGKAPRPMAFKVSHVINSPGIPEQWAWLGNPAQADPAAIAALTAEQRSQFQSIAPGQQIGAAALVTVDSAGSVQWTFDPQILVAAAMAHGEKGSVAKQPDGSYKLAYTLVEPGKPNTPMSFPVARETLKISPLMARTFIAKGLCPAINTSEAWIWAGQDAQQGQAAAAFNVSTNGVVIWNFIPRDAALALLKGDQQPASAPSAATTAGTIPLSVKLVRGPYGGGVRMDNTYSLPLTAFSVSAPGELFTVDSRTKGVPPIAPGGFWADHTGGAYGGGDNAIAVAALFADGTSFGQPAKVADFIERRRVWIATLDDITNRLAKFNTAQPDMAGASAAIGSAATQQVRAAASTDTTVSAATNAAYQFVIECINRKIRTLPGTLQAIEQRRAQILADPIRVADGSSHTITDREVTSFLGSLRASAAKSAEARNNAPTLDQQLQARIPASPAQPGPSPAYPAPSALPGVVLSTTHGTGADVRNGILSYKDADTGAKVTFKVARPAFLATQLQSGAKVGNIGAWVWVSEDGQQGRMFQLASDGSVTATVLTGAMARQFVSGK